jgi:hypothetical protein
VLNTIDASNLVFCVFANLIFRIFELIRWAIIPASRMDSEYFVSLNHRVLWTLFKTSGYLEIRLNFIYFKMYDLQNYTKWLQNGRTPFRRKLRKSRGIFVFDQILMATWSEHSRASLVKVSAKLKPITLNAFSY